MSEIMQRQEYVACSVDRVFYRKEVGEGEGTKVTKMGLGRQVRALL